MAIVRNVAEYEEMLVLLESARNYAETRIKHAVTSDDKKEIPYLENQIEIAVKYISRLTMEKVNGAYENG